MPERAVNVSDVIDVIAEVFTVDAASLGSDSVADDVDGWDSVSHTMLMLALEDRFGVQLSFEETASLPDLRSLTDHIAAKVAED